MAMLDELKVMMELGAELDAAIAAKGHAQIRVLFPQFLDQIRKVHAQMEITLRAVNDAIAKLQSATLK
jgi:hypothetical protein